MRLAERQEQGGADSEQALNNLALTSLKAGQPGRARAWMNLALDRGYSGKATRQKRSHGEAPSVAAASSGSSPMAGSSACAGTGGLARATGTGLASGVGLVSSALADAVAAGASRSPAPQA